MFCPNCGTQNPETAATCSKCNFNLKGAAAPKFKGTMLMMNSPRTPPPPAPPAAGAPAPMPSKLKGTVVGVAPPAGGPPPQAPIAPRPPSIPPTAPAVPPPPPFVQKAATAAFNAFSPQGGHAAGPPINPLGGTLAADNPNAYAQAQAQRPGSGGYGSGTEAFGAPGPALGQPGSGGDFGMSPVQDRNAPSPGAWGAGGAMAPFGGQGGQMMQSQSAPAHPGAHGAKGVVRNPLMTLLLSFISCGLYQIYWFIMACSEMSTYLQRDEPSWWKVVLLSSVTFGIYGLYWQVARCGALVEEMQQRAGLPNPENKGILYIVPYYNVMLLQEELNKVWQSPQ